MPWSLSGGRRRFAAGFGLESPDSAREVLAHLATALVGADLRAPGTLLARVDALAADAPAARGAADVAVHDLLARLDRVPLARRLADRPG